MDYASYQLIYDDDYASYLVTCELAVSLGEHYEQVEVCQDNEIMRFVNMGGQFSAEEEAFFNSEIDPVLVLDQYETAGDRIQLALNGMVHRARSLLAHSAPVRARASA